MLDYLFTHYQLEKYQTKYNLKTNLTGMLNVAIIIGIATAVAYISYKSSIHLNDFWKWVYTGFAFCFSGVYLVYYFFKNIVFNSSPFSFSQHHHEFSGGAYITQ